MLGITQYWIDQDWILQERLVSAEPFSKQSHTSQAIDDTTKRAMAEVGYPTEDVYGSVFHSCSDNGANMVKGWCGFDQGFCGAHTRELAVNTYLASTAVKPTVVKIKAKTAHFHHSRHSAMPTFHMLQKSSGLAENKPQETGNACRWHYTTTLMDFFRANMK